MRSTSSGFSMTTCFFSLSACSASAACVPLGVQIATSEMSEPDRAAPRSPYTFGSGCPASLSWAASASAAAVSPSTSAVTSASGRAAMVSAWVRPMMPQPTMATWWWFVESDISPFRRRYCAAKFAVSTWSADTAKRYDASVDTTTPSTVQFWKTLSDSGAAVTVTCEPTSYVPGSDSFPAMLTVPLPTACTDTCRCTTLITITLCSVTGPVLVAPL